MNEQGRRREGPPGWFAAAGLAVVFGLYAFIAAEIGLGTPVWVFGALAAVCGAVAVPLAVVGLVRWARDAARWVRDERAATRNPNHRPPTTTT